MNNAAIYPGTFDPVTYGHMDLIHRTLSVFDKVVVAVAVNPGKRPLFSIEERVSLIKKAVGKNGLKNVTVESFDTLLVDYCDQKKIYTVVRGLRAVSDFEYELQLSQMNRKINKRVEAVFMMPSEEYNFISSKIIKEVAAFGGDVSELVPAPVMEALRQKYVALKKTSASAKRKPGAIGKGK
ncbi:MAG: pantetheine-phosphate adenylyltransferase [Nitrospinae bacterium]|nr:pantetheine-phosphate adenylyltransferase [Nitrospinota bacterium]